tara:strand:- start:830 stop:1129 length:300 start_codon:yes stop_codon:yes gene_type:complete
MSFESFTFKELLKHCYAAQAWGNCLSLVLVFCSFFGCLHTMDDGSHYCQCITDSEEDGDLITDSEEDGDLISSILYFLAFGTLLVDCGPQFHTICPSSI